MFKKIFIDLCNQKGESPSFVCGKIGISPAAFSQWTDTTIPRQSTIKNVAEYFGVSVDYLLAKKEMPSATPVIEHAKDELWAKICRLTAENRNKVDGYVSALLDEQSRAEIAKTKNA